MNQENKIYNQEKKILFESRIPFLWKFKYRKDITKMMNDYINTIFCPLVCNSKKNNDEIKCIFCIDKQKKFITKLSYDQLITYKNK
jgi:hypothetical protein